MITLSSVRRPAVAVAAAAAFWSFTAQARHDPDGPAHKHHALAGPGGAPSDAREPGAENADQRVGDPYPFDTCPISGEKLGGMGEPVVRVYHGREVRFCCASCPARFEKDLAAGMAELDKKIIEDQGALYPLKISVVTGENLPAHPFEFVYANRLVRLGDESERASFLNHAEKYLGELDRAAIAEQGGHYPMTVCPVSEEEFGSMGEPVDIVLAGRLVRLCCKSCKKEVMNDPARFIAIVDEARRDGQGVVDD